MTHSRYPLVMGEIGREMRCLIIDAMEELY